MKQVSELPLNNSEDDKLSYYAKCYDDSSLNLVNTVCSVT